MERGGGGLNGQNPLIVTKVICRQSLIVYSVLTIDKVKIFCVLCNKIGLPTRGVLSGQREIVTKQRIFRKYLPNHMHIENIDQNINFYDSDKTEIRLPFYKSFSTF